MTSIYPAGDPRAVLASTPAGSASSATGAPARVFALFAEGSARGAAEAPDEVLPRGSRTWIARGRNFVVALTELRAGEQLMVETRDEHIVVVAAGTVEVSHREGSRLNRGANGGEGTAEATASAVIIVPAGTSTLTARTDGRVVRVFTATTTDVAAKARNAQDYQAPAPLVAPLGTPARALARGLRVYRMDDFGAEPGRLGRILRSTSLMINWFPDENEPRDPDRLSPHWHEDFEQCTVTLAGAYVHHLRTAWTARLADWRPDEHIRVASPSVTIIPPPLIHTTQGIEDGLHQLLDIFAPPRQDFLGQGWVLNAVDYADGDDAGGDPVGAAGDRAGRSPR